jgi:hypothetical protein
VGENVELFPVTDEDTPSTDPLDDGKIANPDAKSQTGQQTTDRILPPDSQHDSGDHGHQETLPNMLLIEHHRNTPDTPAEPIRQFPHQESGNFLLLLFSPFFPFFCLILPYEII